MPPGPTTADQAGPGLVSWNYIDLIVVATGSLNLNDQLRASLMQYFESRRMVTTILSIREPVFVAVDLTVQLGVEPTFYAGDVQLRAVEALEGLFSLDNSDFGKPFYLFEGVRGGRRDRRCRVRGRVDCPDAAVSGGRGRGSGRRSGVDPARLREFPRKGPVIATTTEGCMSC